MEKLKSFVEQADWPNASQRLNQLAVNASGYSEIKKILKSRQRINRDGAIDNAGRVPVRIALVGNSTTTFLTPCLELLLEAQGIAPTIFEAGFDSTAREFLDVNSKTAAFAPDVVVVVQSPLAISGWPATSIEAEEADTWSYDGVVNALAMYESAHATLKCDIVVDNYAPLPFRPYGNLGSRIPGDHNSLLSRYNQTLAKVAPQFLYLHDVESLASQQGLREWHDVRSWHQAKQPMSFRSMIPYAKSLARLVASMFRSSRKCLVLDLDNTLWGGVVGDDGAARLEIGPGSPLGEAYSMFQTYVKQLGERGVILAVCSKNEEENAKAPFLDRPEMVLSLEDFAAFKANWNSKPDNIQAIAEELNIGIDSMVFVDDNPAERSIVEQMLPDVAVVDISDDPAEYAQRLDDQGFFDVPRLSAEDRARTQQYRENAERKRMVAVTPDYASYLRSLEQIATVRRFEEDDLDRVTQLVNKTNQFNLTTIRHTRADLVERMNDASSLTLTVRLQDRFGDNGLISVLYGRYESGSLHIDQWLMSCRVFKRDVEFLVFDLVAEEARKRGASLILSTYCPTAKNKLVADLYPQLGFERGLVKPKEYIKWEFDLNDWKPREFPIGLIDERTGSTEG